MVRIWRTSVKVMDRQHLLGEHYELHVVVSALLRGKGAWFKHPQTKRFYNHIGQLVDRHMQQVREFNCRGYNHKSPIMMVDVYEPYVHDNEDLELLMGRQKKV